MSDPLAILSSLRLESGARWGEAAVPEQLADAAAVFGDGPRRHWLGRARGWSKTTDAAAFTIAAMLADLPAGASCVAAAGDADQARLLARAIAGFARRTPELRDVIRVQSNRVQAPGVTLDVVASDASTGFGVSPSWLIIDEACQWGWTQNAESFFSDVLITSLAKTPGARCIIISTSGRPGSWQERAYKYALSEPELWRVSDIHGPPPWMPTSLVEAERRRLPEASFKRWFLNEWVESADALASVADIQAAISHTGPLDPQPAMSYTIGVDLGTRHDPSVAVIAHRLPGVGDPVVVVDRLMAWQGTRAHPVDLTDVEAWILSAAKTFNRAKIRVESWQGTQLTQRLRNAGLQAEEVFPTQADGSRRTTALMLALRDRRLRIPDDAELVSELQTVVVVETAPNVYRVDHRAGAHNDRVIAMSLAVAPLLQANFVGGAVVHVPSGRGLLPFDAGGEISTPGWGSLSALPSSTRWESSE